MANSKSGGRSGAHSAPPPKSPPPNPGRNAHPGARMGHQDAPRYDPTRKSRPELRDINVTDWFCRVLAPF